MNRSTMSRTTRTTTTTPLRNRRTSSSNHNNNHAADTTVTTTTTTTFMTKRATKMAAILESLAVALLLGTGFLLLVIFGQNMLLWRLMGGIVLGQSFSCVLLMIPLVQDSSMMTTTTTTCSNFLPVRTMSIQTSRATAVTTSITGLFFVVFPLIEFYFNHDDNAPPTHYYNNYIVGTTTTGMFETSIQVVQELWEFMKEQQQRNNNHHYENDEIVNWTLSQSMFLPLQVLLHVGTCLLVLSCGSLMASFWPALEEGEEEEEFRIPQRNRQRQRQEQQQQQQQQQQPVPRTIHESIPLELQQPLLSTEENDNDDDNNNNNNDLDQLGEDDDNEQTLASEEKERNESHDDEHKEEQAEEGVADASHISRRSSRDEENDPYVTLTSTASTATPLDEEEEVVRMPSSGNDDNDVNDNDVNDEQQHYGGGQESASSRIRGTRRLLQLAATEVGYLYAGCAVLLIRLPFSLAIPHFVSTTLSALSSSDEPDFTTARNEISWLILLGTIDAMLDFWCVFLFGYANQRIVKGLRIDLFARLIRQEVAFFDKHGSGELASRLNSDCSEMAGDLTWFFRFSIESVVRITGIATYMCIRCPILGACALSIVPVVAVINKLYGDWLRQNAIAVQDSLAAANAVAQETLSNIRTVLAFAAEDQESNRYDNKVQRQYRLNVRQLYMTGVYYMAVSTFLINTIVQGVLLYIGSELIQRGILTSDVLLAFMLYQGQLQNETMNLFNSYSSLIKSSGAGDKVFALLDRQPPHPAIGCLETDGNGNTEDDAMAFSTNDAHSVSVASLSHDAPHSPPVRHHDLVLFDTSAYHIHLKQVSFSYPSRPEALILDELDLEIPKGQTLALVGSSGCGKTTIINLLQRFYDPTGGAIYINDVNLKQLDLTEHRRNIGVVTQDPVLFQGTLWDNIIYGSNPSPSSVEEQVVRAAQLAHADDFIREFPDGYHTNVGERGITLSGGQRQRIAIARAIFQQRSLLLLDEATSALDTESEIAVQEALDRLLENQSAMTTVVVAHRLRTVQNADRIVVLNKGKVVEQGKHEELLQMNGIYRKMVERASTTGLLDERE